MLLRIVMPPRGPRTAPRLVSAARPWFAWMSNPEPTAGATRQRCGASQIRSTLLRGPPRLAVDLARGRRESAGAPRQGPARHALAPTDQWTHVRSTREYLKSRWPPPATRSPAPPGAPTVDLPFCH